MKFHTIVADPPWIVDASPKVGRYATKDGRQTFHRVAGHREPVPFKMMSVREICAVPVEEMAERNAHLYLWCINRYVEDAFAIARAWGFKPSTLLVWAKNPMGGGMGGTYGVSTEFVLFCRRGTLPAKQRIGGTWWNWKRPYLNGKPRHSAKPTEFQGMVQDVSPGPYLELFARQQRQGWTCLGNELEEVTTL